MDTQEKIFISAQEYLDDVEEQISKAQYTIDVESYILRNDAVGKRVLAKLLAAANRGVRVRVIVDGFGSKEWVSNQKSFSLSDNMQIRVYHPVPLFSGELLKLDMNHFGKMFNFLSRIQKRNHKKLFIIDKKYVYTGSVNIWGEALEWRELGIRISDSVEEIQYYFDFTWERAYFSIKRLPHGIKKQQIRSISTNRIRCNFDIKTRSKSNSNLLQHIDSAKEKIWIMTPYFVPPLKFVNGLIRAAKRGVDVKLLLPSEIDLPFMKLANRFYSYYLLNNGIKIAEYQPSILHGKLMIFDQLCILGSSNFDHRSFLLNLELDVATSHNNSYIFLNKTYKQDFEDSKLVKIEDLNKQTWYQTIISYVLLLIKNWL